MSYAYGASDSAFSRLFTGSPHRRGDPLPPPWDGAAASEFNASGPLSLSASAVCIGAFRIERWGQTFISASELRIDIALLPAERLRLIAAHDFRIEDRNPDLDQCIAGVFFARFTNSRWEAPEDSPLECRSIAVLGEIDWPVRHFVAR